jgi:phage replication-related protein YjqB (UPF0714/DUF867 family)
MNNNIMSIDNLRLEIAILQEDIQSKNPGYANFIIPAILPNPNAFTAGVNNSNILNRSNNLSGVELNMNANIKLKVPTEYTYFSDEDTISAGAKFIVAFVGGNINDAQIIGRHYE